jgi:hypothetical protein
MLSRAAVSKLRRVVAEWARLPERSHASPLRCGCLWAIPRDEGRGWLDCPSRTDALPYLGSPVRWPGSRPLDREHPGVQPVAIVIRRPQAAHSGESAHLDAALLSRLSLQRSVPGVWLLRAGIQMPVPSWRQFLSLSARQHLESADRDQCGACHSGCRFFAPPAPSTAARQQRCLASDDLCGRSGTRVLRELEGSTRHTGLSRRNSAVLTVPLVGC